MVNGEAEKGERFAMGTAAKAAWRSGEAGA